MILDLIALLTAQTFSNVLGIYARHAPQGTYTTARTEQKAWVTVSRNGGDRNSSLDGNDASYIQTDVTIEVHSPSVTIDAPIAEAIARFLESSIHITMGSRTLFGAVVDDPEDFDNPPLDGSDNWDGGTRIIAHLEHN